ncbi:signal transduction histidine kinase [Motilibacter peucedani]|uniref:histidine kinase n=1 Tax=Motilibacter peucedani TaxID=598650 RepID=A0A420XQI3_9ACTN|nr:HAMP domain-containing sensor histidine kinase [Motilibacter peucedani]RKS75568.1 signal transduction histidine kinase [Motilibacter peucedani]
MRLPAARRWPRSLRRRQALASAVAGLAVAVLSAGATYELARTFLLDQRQRTVLRQTYLDAAVLQAQLRTAGVRPSEALAALDSRGATALLLHRQGSWYSSSLDVDSRSLPRELVEAVRGQSVAVVPARVLGAPSLVVGVPLPAVDAEVYEVRPQQELQQTLRTLALVLASGAAAATVLSAALGAWSGRAVLRPLDPLASTAAAIASGELSHRLPDTDDPELSTIVASFNSMADAVQQRIERDARFAADVSHELRSPLTTLVGSVDLLVARKHELSPAGRTALTLVEEELARLRTLLEDLIALSRADPAALRGESRTFDLRDLVRQLLADRRQPPELLLARGPQAVTGDPRVLARAVANLLDNAQRHGGGAVAVVIDADGDDVLLSVDDAGPGVPPHERDRVFERFATLKGARGSTSGSGLGLALVRESAEAHGGAVWCSERPGGGARFTVRLPRADA